VAGCLGYKISHLKGLRVKPHTLLRFPQIGISPIERYWVLQNTSTKLVSYL
jgi:hypothetical protein